jgi:hypothetical protein
MKKHSLEQRSVEWHKLRLGKLGGSECIGITTPARMKTTLNKKLAETLTGVAEEVFVNEAMQYGIDWEDFVSNRYSSENFINVENVGAITNDDYPLAILSPDGLIGELGAIEIKCPQPKTFVEMSLLMINGKKGLHKIVSNHRPQIIWYFVMMPKIDYVDYVIYNDGFTKAKCDYRAVRISRTDIIKDINLMIASYKVYEANYNQKLYQILGI